MRPKGMFTGKGERGNIHTQKKNHRIYTSLQNMFLRGEREIVNEGELHMRFLFTNAKYKDDECGKVLLKIMSKGSSRYIQYPHF